MRTTQDFAARRAEVVARLTTLREKRGAALADGKRFDDGQIAAAEDELSALDDAEAELARRERFKNSGAYKAQRQKDIAALLGKDADRLECVRRKQNAICEYIQAVKDEHAICAEERRLFSVLKKPQPDILTMPEDIGAQLLAAQMTSIAHKGNYGRIRWHGTRFTSETDWVATVTIPNLKELFFS